MTLTKQITKAVSESGEKCVTEQRTYASGGGEKDSRAVYHQAVANVFVTHRVLTNLYRAFTLYYAGDRPEAAANAAPLVTMPRSSLVSPASISPASGSRPTARARS